MFPLHRLPVGRCDMLHFMFGVWEWDVEAAATCQGAASTCPWAAKDLQNEKHKPWAVSLAK